MTARVAIVATAARTALGEDLDATMAALGRGRTALRPVAGFDASGFGDVYAAQIWTEPAGGEDDPALRILGRHGHLLEGVIQSAYEDGRAAALAPEDVGLFVSMGVVDSVVEDLAPAVLASRGVDGRLDYERFFAGAYRQVHPLWPLAMLNNVAAGQISIDLGLRGDNLVLSSEADGCVRALLEGMESIREGTARAALTGGVSECVGPASLARLRLRGVLGEGPLRPCAADGSGTAPGEAAAAFLLGPEHGEGVVAPAAFLRGGGTAWGRDPSRPGPTADALGRAIDAALASADVNAKDVGAVFLHAEGRAAQDAAEREAVESRVGEAVPLVAIKGALGHTGSAAPALDLAVAVRSLETRELPPACMGPAPDGPVRTRPAPDLRFVLILAAGAQGGAGALVVEAAR